MLLTLLVAFGVASHALAAFESGMTYAVTCSSERYGCHLARGSTIDPNSHAYGSFVDDVQKDGWGKIWVHGDATVDGWYQAGFLEGALTSKRIYQHYKSWYDYQFGASPPSDALLQFMYDQRDWAMKLAMTRDNLDPYYATLKKVLNQMQGVLDGQNYAAAEGEKLDLAAMLLLQAAGDLYDIMPAVDASGFKLHVGKVPREEFHDLWHKQISCSALIRVTPDNSDVLLGHTSWTTYQSMLRIFKHYDLDSGLYQSSHSSKPGLVYSKDDFYVLPRNKLVVIETTNGVMNPDLYKLVTPESLLTWQRLPITNTLARSGPEWVDMVSKFSSGTYANQWMVADMKLFTPGKGVAAKDFLWIVEQAPGLSVKNDVTSVLRAHGGYWPSYNMPFDKSVYVITGFEKAYETYGDEYSYANCTRGQMFARDAPNVQSLGDLQKFLRYNDYQNDPLSKGNAAAAISSRYDLRTSNPKTFGGVDTKVTSYSRVMGRLAPSEGFITGQVGPTHDNQAPFQWSTSPWADEVHLGQPDVFNFGFAEQVFNQY